MIQCLHLPIWYQIRENYASSEDINPPACRRVLWILLCFGLASALALKESPLTRFSTDSPPPPPPLPSPPLPSSSSCSSSSSSLSYASSSSSSSSSSSFSSFPSPPSFPPLPIFCTMHWRALACVKSCKNRAFCCVFAGFLLGFG